MKIRTHVLAAAAIAVGLFSATARADAECSGQIGEFLVNTRGSWNNIPSETCFSWLAITGSAKTHAKQISIYYHGSVNCTALGTYYGSPAPV